MQAAFAELVGVLLGDGSISVYESEKYSTYYRVQITLDSREGQYAAYLCKLFEVVWDEPLLIGYRNGDNAVDLCCFKKDVVLSLLDAGMVRSPKWERACVPDWARTFELGKKVLRGYFDTDGAVVLTDNNGTLYPRLEMKISPAPMQEHLLGLLSMYGFRFGAYDIGRGKVRVQMNGLGPLRLWEELVGFRNERHLEKLRQLKRKKASNA